MKGTTIATVFLAAWMSCALAGTTAVASAQVMGLGAPMTVRLVGTFAPWEKDRAPGPETLAVTVAGKRFFFHVTDVASYQGSDPTMMLVNHLFPPELEFLGPTHRLDALASPVKGRSYAVEGWLYPADNMFYVSAVKPLSS